MFHKVISTRTTPLFMPAAMATYASVDESIAVSFGMTSILMVAPALAFEENSRNMDFLLAFVSLGKNMKLSADYVCFNVFLPLFKANPSLAENRQLGSLVQYGGLMLQSCQRIVEAGMDLDMFIKDRIKSQLVDNPGLAQNFTEFEDHVRFSLENAIVN